MISTSGRQTSHEYSHGVSLQPSCLPCIGVHTTVAQESSPIINGGDTNLPVSLSSSSNSLAEGIAVE